MLGIVWVYLLALQSWSQLESALPATTAPVFLGSLPKGGDANKPVLYRDAAGLSVDVQQVWLALEIKEVDYVTVLVSVDDESMPVPTVQWTDGTKQTNVVEILEKIQKEYAERPPDLYKGVSVAVDNVRSNMQRFDPVFPRNTDPTLYAPYMFRKGEVTFIDSHLVTLEGADEVLEEYDDGPYLCGEELSAADIYWAPYLERYAAQLPLTHDGDMLEPRYGGRYEAIEEWFHAMETLVPCYACRVAGDSVSWENVLKEAVKNGLVPKVDLFPSRGKRVPLNRLGDKTTALWNEYTKTRPYLCETPAMECVAHIVRHRDQILTEAVAVEDLKELDKDDIDQALLETVGALLGRIEASELSGKAREVVAFLDSRLRVPRDMGMIPAAALRALVVTAPKSTIKG